MRQYEFVETCSCGAEFRWQGSDGYHLSWVTKTVENWREAHKHAEFAGICADQPEPFVLRGGEIDQPWCILRAGHVGAHSSDDGRHWIKAKSHGTAHESAEQGAAVPEGHEDATSARGADL